ncbi:MAG: geranylgeranyl reductase family protein [Mycobacteriaceae bacterium]|nr:geranylgeranyl reductase family protein [Mycobacteriaceae bacterium]MBV9641749.1 geranylgeranyl reductase family protein [Mycobacteriaceae bacterium]
MGTRADVVVVGAGPAGSAAAAWAARAGRDVLVVDAADFPRDKPCGDGLTPRAVAELQLLGLGRWLDAHIKHRGLRLTGFGGEVEVDWPGPSFPTHGSAVPRTELDERIRQVAVDAGASMLMGRRVVGVSHDPRGRVTSLAVRNGGGATELRCGELIVADGARSPLGRMLGRQWHRQTTYGVAVRGYLTSPRSDDPWLSTNLELRTRHGHLLPGYGWIFPLGNGEVNIGVGALATEKRPADVALKKLIDFYADLRRADWEFDGPPRAVVSALLPMGGAVSGVAGPNWMLIGDAAACVNPMNGEGIDYGLETGRFAADLLGTGDLSTAWPSLLQQQYARAFSIARRLSALLTVPWFLPTGGPFAMRSAKLMDIVVRVMGNLITDDDIDWVARLWRGLGSASQRIDRRPPFS